MTKKQTNIENHYATDNLAQWITESIAEWEAVYRASHHRKDIPAMSMDMLKRLGSELLVVRANV
jgi:hypothetical protein